VEIHLAERLTRFNIHPISLRSGETGMRTSADGGRTAPSRPLVTASFIAAALILSGCASDPNPKPIPISEMGGQQRWTAADMVDVAISEADKNRADEHYGLFGKYPASVATGDVWSKIFVGDLQTSPVFKITAAKLQDETIAAGFAIRIHYMIDGTLAFNGRDYPIHAEGARASGGLFFAAMHEAVQLGVIDAATKVKFIVSGGLNSPPSPAPAQ
jgi:hypothetical protein